jgi:hypothetical protein
MQPPFHITGNSDADWVILAVSVVVCLYWLRALRLAREGARLFLRNLTIAGLSFIGFRLLLSQTHATQNNVIVVSGFGALVVFGMCKKRFKRSRYYSRATKRAVIARDLKGAAYDSTKYHIDHRWPFSKGGSNTADNLRVILKEKNLKKGAKRPKMREMW